MTPTHMPHMTSHRFSTVGRTLRARFGRVGFAGRAGFAALLSRIFALLIGVGALSTAWAQSQPVKSLHLHLWLQANDKGLEASWADVCPLFGENFAPGTGPWGFGLFKSHGCIKGNKLISGTSSKEAWLLRVGQNGGKIVFALHTPAIGKGLRAHGETEPRVAIEFDNSRVFALALRNPNFVQAVVAYLMDGLPFITQVTKENYKTLTSPEPARNIKGSLLPPAPSKLTFLDVRMSPKTGDVRVKVVAPEDLESALAGGNIWAGKTNASETLQEDVAKALTGDLQARAAEEGKKLEAERKARLAKERAANDKAEQEKKLKAQAEKDKELVDLGDDADEPEKPTYFDIEAYVAGWPQGFLGAKNGLLGGGAHFGVGTSQAARLMLGVDASMLTRDAIQPSGRSDGLKTQEGAQAELTALHGWVGFLLGIDIIPLIGELELFQSVGYAHTGLSIEKDATVDGLVSGAQGLAPMYQVNVATAFKVGALSFMPFGGYKTSIGTKTEYNIISGGLRTDYEISNGGPTAPMQSLGVFLTYRVEQVFYRSDKMIKSGYSDLFYNFYAHGLLLGVRKGF